ncbi:hypothetical protein GGR25_001538 [Kaistia hirudinis]|uniref:NACHT domain-containing protein n=1 Tax=Kaistia hirudinis TaxID=1293440 RepID=A0A840AJI1_9HYPH|nr:NACHT domain-containing protein [Kaistia hirudinis]MBB3930499.1 hypothetical protein [Kaistia hirudinis]
MSAEVDPNVIAAAALTDLIKTTFNTVINGVTKKFEFAWNKVFTDFDPYCRRVYQINSHVRIICAKDRDIPLYDIYVESKFYSSEGIYSDEEIVQKIRDGDRIVISGNGGTGKTFFMRHLWMTIFRNPMGVIPIFIELRNLSRSDTSIFKDSLMSIMSPARQISVELFDYFCNHGSFCFILDGFDEIPHDNRDDIQSSILSFASQFPKCPMVVSSRPDERFSGWQQFHVLSPRPFEYTQMIDLVEKIPIADDIKESFKSSADEVFYERHESFLSNPLLCIMMVMTFRDNMDIPENMNAFYDQAFITLYSSHDATKAWSRDSTLSIDQFRKIFGIFSAISYYEEKFEFNEYELLSYIDRSIKVIKIDASVDEVRRDIVESVNLMQQDGLYIYFIHRSFQEYFTAYAITHLLNKKAYEYLKKIKTRISDNVIAMAFEMNEHIVIEGYIRPEIEEHGIFDRVDDECIGIDFLECLDCNIAVNLKQSGGGISRFSIIGPVPNKIRDFVVNINKMRSEKSSEVLDVFERSDVNEQIRLILEEFETLLDSRQEFDINMSVAFRDGKVNIDYNSLYESGVVYDVICRIRRKIDEKAEEDGEELKEIIRSARHWCGEVMRLDQERAASIDEIFGPN